MRVAPADQENAVAAESRREPTFVPFYTYRVASVEPLDRESLRLCSTERCKKTAPGDADGVLKR